MRLARPVQKIQRLQVSASPLEPPTVSTTGSPLFSLYTLRGWLERFPPGTKFAISPYFFIALSPAEVQDRFPEIWEVLHEKKLEVVGPAPTFDAYGRCLSEKTNTFLPQFNNMQDHSGEVK